MLLLVDVDEEDFLEFFEYQKKYYFNNLKDINPFFLLNYKFEETKKFEDIINKIDKKNLGILIKFDNLNVNFNKAVNFINNLKKDYLFVVGEGGFNKINKFFVEKTKIDFLLNPHNTLYFKRYDFIHHLNSGLNQTLCKDMHEKDIILMNSLNFLIGENNFEIGREYVRIKQNIKICKKKKGTNIFFTFILNFKIWKNIIKNKKKDKFPIYNYDLKKILYLFNLSEKERINNNKIFLDRIETNKLKKEGIYLHKFVQKIN